MGYEQEFKKSVLRHLNIQLEHTISINSMMRLVNYNFLNIRVTKETPVTCDSLDYTAKILVEDFLKQLQEWLLETGKI